MLFDKIEHTTGSLPHKVKFYIVYGKMFFLLIHFIEDCKLPKGISHVLSVPLTLEYVGILSWSISSFFYFNWFTDDVLCKIPIWTDDTALHVSCNRQSDLLQQAEIVYQL